MIAFVSETKEILHGWFRCGSAYTSNGIVEFMKECMAYMRKGGKVIVRGDGGFFEEELLDYLESLGAGYLIKTKMKNLLTVLGRWGWVAVPGYPGWEQTESYYQCGTWSCARRFVAVRKLVGEEERGLFTIPEYEYFCYVTTEALSPIEAHERYGQRATCETWNVRCKKCET